MRGVEPETTPITYFHLINSIDESEGLFLVYAATPDFFMDDRYGLATYGALSQRMDAPKKTNSKGCR